MTGAVLQTVPSGHSAAPKTVIKEWCSRCGGNLRAQEPFAFGNVEIVGHGAIIFAGRPIDLPRTLYSLADSIIRGRGRGVTCGVLAERLGSDVFDDSIKKYIERLRNSFRADNPHFDQIETIRGFGAYRWRFEEHRPGKREAALAASMSQAASS